VVPPGPALPFSQSPTPAPAEAPAAPSPLAMRNEPVAHAMPPATTSPPALTVKQYASLCVELLHELGRPQDILARYGLGAEQLDALDAEWQVRFGDPDALVEWNQAFTEYQAWLLAGGKVK
jgi:hypothetical protein